SASSSRWLARQKSDPFVRLRSAPGPGSPGSPDAPAASAGAYRSRAAFKLLEIQRRFRLVREGDTVLDLGCAPGAWLQVASELLRLGEKERGGRLVGVDLLRTDALEGATVLHGDFLERSTQLRLARACTGLAPEGEEWPGGRWVDVILSDMAPNITGNKTADTANMLRLVQAVAGLAVHCLALRQEGRGRGGNLVMKYFAHPELADFKRDYLAPHFRSVMEFKPKSSRSESAETYWVCM
ncbi:23S ribosomal RNA methyltransferase, partial [Calocera cornea HHB12733]